MSEINIQAKLATAYAKAGQVLGSRYNVYRPVTLNDSLSAANFIKKQFASFTLSKSMVDAQPEGFKTFLVYTDNSDIKQGDIFDNTKETFVIIWNRGIENTLAIRAGYMADIFRPNWTTDGGLKPELIRIAKNVPTSVTGLTSAPDVRINSVTSSGQAKRWELRIWTLDTDIQQTDNIKLGIGINLHVDSIKQTEHGLTLSCTETT